MKIIYKYDVDGFYIGEEQIIEDAVIPVGYTDVTPTIDNKDGSFSEFVRAKFVDGKWIEGATTEEVSLATPPSQLNILGQQLSQEKLKNIQLNTTVSTLQQEIELMKIDIENLKGATP